MIRYSCRLLSKRRGCCFQFVVFLYGFHMLIWSYSWTASGRESDSLLPLEGQNRTATQLQLRKSHTEMFKNSNIGNGKDQLKLRNISLSVEKQMLKSFENQNINIKGNIENRRGPDQSNSMEKDSKPCDPVKLRFESNLPVTALVSYPGSGNTWVRHLLQQATGIATGSIYNDGAIRRAGFIGEGSTTNTIAIKTHEFACDARSRYQRAILIIRNPYDAMKAEFNRRHGGHIGNAKKYHYDKYWKDFVAGESFRWYLLNVDWISYFHFPLHILHFDKLVENTKEELKALLTFLNVTIDSHAIDCVLKDQDGRFKRNKIENTQGYELYPQETKDYIQQSEEAVQIAIEMREQRKERGQFKLRDTKHLKLVPGPVDVKLNPPHAPPPVPMDRSLRRPLKRRVIKPPPRQPPKT